MAELSIIIRAIDNASTTLKGISGTIQGHAAEIRKAGLAMTAFGAAVTGALGLAVKAAAEEQAGVQRLAQALKNVGVSYDDVKDSLEGVITATQRKTGIADDEQREILGRLLLVTNDYQRALDLLPLTLDLAAAGQMDATTAATYLGKAMLELESGADKVTVRLGQASMQFSSLAEIEERVAGAAEAAANPFAILKAEMGDITEKIGSYLLPMLTDLKDKIIPIIDKVYEWVDAHPELAKTILIVVGAIGGLMAVLGPLLIILPGLIAALPLLGVAFTIATGPIGIIIAAIAALIAIGILVWKNWDTIKAKAIEIWEGIKTFFISIWDKIRTIFSQNWDKILAILFPAVGIPILIARNWDTIKEYVKGLWDKVTDIFRDWWENIKSFLSRLNPWEWMKQGWEKLKEGIGGILSGIFGGSMVEDWTRGISNYLGAVDLKTAASKMFSGVTEAAGEALGETVGILATSVETIKSMFLGAGYPERTAANMATYYARTVERKGEETAARMFGLQEGGIVTKPTFALIGEGGPEAVVPLERMGGEIHNHFHFYEPVFAEREESLNKWADKLAEIQARNQRLMFGSAYSG